MAALVIGIVKQVERLTHISEVNNAKLIYFLAHQYLELNHFLPNL